MEKLSAASVLLIIFAFSFNNLVKCEKSGFVDPIKLLKQKMGDYSYEVTLKKISALLNITSKFIRHYNYDSFDMPLKKDKLSTCKKPDCSLEFATEEAILKHCKSVIGEKFASKSAAHCPCCGENSVCNKVNLTMNEEKYTEFNGTAYWNEMFKVASEVSPDAVKILSGIKSSVNAQMSKTSSSVGKDSFCENPTTSKFFMERFSQGQISADHIENLLFLTQIEAISVVKFLALELEKGGKCSEDLFKLSELNDLIVFPNYPKLEKPDVSASDIFTVFQTIDCLSNNFECEFCKLWTKLQAKSAHLAYLYITGNDYESPCCGLLTLLNSFKKHADSFLFLDQCSETLADQVKESNLNDL